MFIFLETEVKQRIYALQQESEKQRYLQKKKETISTKQSLQRVKSIKKSKPLLSN
ncbi:hypothetical protein KHA96_09825 [Bacillus sp. FJAT-49711]|uniref:hypothetical protein n=1 Tax=Bacillus sp. FJAT-49711 TaxID=2833585 RepID=UPI001BC91E85|nr:hypothetical protein [Bacillus sp. FJAT-49711]MBS4218609.1 hypothetical protein [Bacillus sp. FJAT-49711]